MLERTLAAIVLVVCVAMLVRLAIGTKRRLRLDAAVRRWQARWRRTASGLRHWRAARRDAERARKLADDLIQRARSRAAPDGEPPASRPLRKPPRDKMH